MVGLHAKCAGVFSLCLGVYAFFSFFYKPANGYLAPRELSKISLDISTLPCKLYIVDKGFVLGRDGDVLTSELTLVPSTSLHSDLSLRPADKMLDHHLLRQRTLILSKKIPGTVAVIASGAANCYFHWMFDVLPKLYALQASHLRYDHLFLPQITRAFQSSTLEILGIDWESAIQGRRSTRLQADKVIACELPTKSLQVKPWAIDFLRSKFLPTSGPATTKRLYLSRAKALSRKIENEIALVNTLQKYGFESLFAEDLTIPDQAWLFSQAELIICPHGSGLTNLAFCKKGTRVLELAIPDGKNPDCYKHLANLLQLPYSCLECTWVNRGELNIDIPKVEKWIQDNATISAYSQ